MKARPIPHLAKKSTGAKDSLLSKPTVAIKQKRKGNRRARRTQQAVVDPRDSNY